MQNKKSIFYTRIVISCIVILQVSIVQAQPIAKFTSDIVSGCNPIVVSFTDQSTGGPTTWFWDFGNGNTSTLQNPQVSYTVSGSYTVSLKATNSSGSNTISKTAYITVFKNPTANLTATSATNGCVPFTIGFSDQSIEGDGVVSKWTWDFGDGGISAAKNPTYTYSTSGVYNVSLHVVDINGCSDTRVYTSYITVNSKPKPQFSVNTSTYCSIPAAVTFTNSSTGNGTLTYRWDFGDGNTANSKDTTYTYLTSGTYNVKLVVTDQNGCSDSIIENSFVKINSIKASFKPDNDSICPGVLVAMNDASNGANSYFWSFGDGNTTTVPNPKYIYFNPGTYVVKLKVENTGNCKDSISKTILVDDIEAGYSAFPLQTCHIPFEVDFTDLSKNAVSWVYYFGNGDTSHSQNPTYSYQTVGSHQTSLVVKSAAGCTDSFAFKKQVNIEPPVAEFIGDTMRGCAPLTVNFTDKSFSNETIISWKWYFSDGDSSHLQNPTHTFYDDTTYQATLFIENDSGCVSFTYKIIEVGLKPIIDFIVMPDSNCAHDSVLFADMSTNPNGKPNDEWLWTFGDMMTGSGANVYHMHVDTGYMKTMLIVGQNGCYDTLIVDSSNYVLAPVSIVLPFFACDSPFNYTFIQIPKGVDHWEIDFGDGLKLDHLTNDTLTHTYGAYGNYKVKTKAYNDSTGCTWPNEIDVNIGHLDADFMFSDSTPCVGDSILFVLKTGSNFNTYWKFGNGNTSSDYLPLYAYNKPGTYRVDLLAIDFSGCRDSVSKFITVSSITADYQADSFICVPDQVVFTDLSSSDTTIVSWNWHFGNGQYSTNQNPTHNYVQSGTFSPRLIVVNAAGCADTIMKTASIFASKPTAGFYTLDNSLCLHDSAVFVNTSSGILSDYDWTFGDGSSSKDIVPGHIYSKAGQYSIRLIVTDTAGCKDTATVNNYIQVEDSVIANFFADTIFSNCYPLLVKFSDQSIASNIIYWEWDFGDNTALSFIQNPAHNYQLPGTYDVQLNIITSFACVDTISKTKYITVKGPLADFEVDPDTICTYEFVKFTLIQKENVKLFEWDFGDGYVETGQIDSILHTYSRGGVFFPKLIYEDSTGTCRKSADDLVFVSQVIADFQPSDTNGTVPLLIDFTNFSSTNAISWIWNFGEGADTMSEDAAHYYKMAGDYLVSLIVQNDFGCLDSITKLIVIDPLEALVDFPSAFTPNGDGKNDQVKVEGYGVRFKELLGFQIFNRFGEVVFETSDPEIGWDGYYKGKLQNMETYIYLVTVKTFEDQVISEKGYISLLY
ncbi:MAG: PKD domain-containing protein [Bacteroidetes bacterium]|nr:PKD domain-containing protein [Bacteroidota bacterium]